MIDYHNGIFAVDSGYVRPQLMAQHIVVDAGRAAFVDTWSTRKPITASKPTTHPRIESDPSAGKRNVKIWLPSPETTGRRADVLSALADTLRGGGHGGGRQTRCT